MKRIYSIISLCFLAAATMVSCSDDEKMNTGNATVAFGEAEYSVKESKGIFNIPIVVTGEQNGPIEVSIGVSSDDPQCKEDVNFLITSKNIIIPADKKQVSVEIKAVDDRIINDDRHFSLHLASANGASVSTTNASTKITLTDNDDIPYERMAGTWTVTAGNIFDESGKEVITWDINLDIVDEDNPSYGSLITASPWAAGDGSVPVFDELGSCLTHQMTFHHNESTGKTTVDMQMGTVMATNLNFGVIEGIDFSKSSVYSATNGMTGHTRNGIITGTVNDDFNEIVFNNSLYMVVYPENISMYYLYYAAFNNIRFKLKK